MTPAMLPVACPACRGSELLFWRRKGHFHLFRCSLCQHLFLFPGPIETTDIYSKDYFSGATDGFGYVDYDRDKEPMRQTFLEYLQRIKKHAPQKGRVLDVGAATGFFLEIALAHGWQAEGLEISDYAATRGREKSLPITTGSLKSFVPSHAFSVITLWDVLEHFSDPEQELALLDTLLEKGGILALNTPDSGSFFARLLGIHWHLIVPPEHIHYFTAQSLTTLLARHHFRVVSLSRIGKKFTIAYILSIISKSIPFPWLQKLLLYLQQIPCLQHWQIPINLHDNMFVLAQKEALDQKL